MKLSRDKSVIVVHVNAKGGREAIETYGRYQLREPVVSYQSNFTPEDNGLGLKTRIFWMILFEYQ